MPFTRRYHRGLVTAILMWILAGPASGVPGPGVEEGLHALFPDGDAITGPQGSPPLYSVAKDGRLLGYGFLTDQVVPIPAYSGKPISTLVGLGTNGYTRGIRILHHEEPILAVGVSERDLARFVDQYQFRAANLRYKLGGGDRPGYVTLDGISGASITAMVLNASIVRSLHQVAKSTGLVDPDNNIIATDPAYGSDEPIWRETWRTGTTKIIILVVALFVLTWALFFQHWIVQRPRLHQALRNGFLLFTLFFLGWYSLAQLSVVNVLTFVSSLIHDFQWEAFLIDPLMFILWTYVAVLLVLWGRGVYCGWLCPFGALQEFAYKIGKWLKVPDWELPSRVHQRMWAIKYIIFLALFGISLQSLEVAARLSEVEPFKTAITLRFDRTWPFVAYALGLVLLSAANRKFFCKYLCPLGAALAIPARLSLFDWLERYPVCGKPCQICANECEMDAIGPNGEIYANECHYCMDCQVTLNNDSVCPPLVHKRKRREKHKRSGASVEVAAPVAAAIQANSPVKESGKSEPAG